MGRLSHLKQAKRYAIAVVKELIQLRKEIKVLKEEKEEYKLTYELISDRVEAVSKKWREDHPYAHYTPDLGSELEWAFNKINFQEKEIKRLMKWIADLLSNRYVNCVYCGHRYGKTEDTLSSMSEVLYEHIKECEYHPLAEAREIIRILLPFIENQCTTCQHEHYPGDCGSCFPGKSNWKLKEEMECLINQLGPLI